MERDTFHVPYLSDKIPEAAFHGHAVKTAAYLRVSTAQQDVRSQRLATLEYARKHDCRIDDFIEATASGQASEKRRRLDGLMHVLQRGDRLVVSELSPFGRSLGPSLDRQAPSRADTLTPVRTFPHGWPGLCRSSISHIVCSSIGSSSSIRMDISSELCPMTSRPQGP